MPLAAGTQDEMPFTRQGAVGGLAQKRFGALRATYSRVGFVHQFRPLGGAELRNVIRVQSQQLGPGLELHDGSILRINDVTTFRPELVEAAQQSLVIGAL